MGVSIPELVWNGTSWGGVPPVTQSSVTAVAADGSVTINWTDVPGATAYRVSRDGVDANGTGPWSTQVAAGTFSFAFLGLVNGAAYQFGVQALPDGAVVNTTATPLAVLPPADPPPVVVPTVTLTTVIGSGFVTVNWTSVAGATGYRVGRNGADTSGFGAWSTDDPATTSSRTFDKLVNGFEYTFTCQPLPSGAPTSIKATPLSSSGNPPPTPPPVGGIVGNVPFVGRSGLAWNSLVFLGGSSDTYPAFESWRKRPVDGVMVFPSRYTYDQMGQTIPRRSGDLMVWAVSPFGQGSGVNNAQVAAGGQDGNIATWASRLVAAGWNTNRTIIRLGWENNGNWYEWGWDRGGIEAWKGAYRRFVQQSRAAGLTNVIWNWCLNKGPQGYNSGYSWTLGYPGDDVVDVVGIDSYDYYTKQVDETSWRLNTVGRNPGLEDVAAFVRSRGKLMSVDEWGVCNDPNGGGDNAWYVGRMFQWLKDNASIVAWEVTYDHDGAPSTFRHKLSNGQNPLAAAAYRKTWPYGWGG